MRTKRSWIKGVALASVAVLGVSTLSLLPAEAAGFGQVMVRLDRMKASTPTTGTVCARTSTSGQTEADVQVTYPTGFTLGAAGTFTTTTTNLGWPSGAAAWPGIGTATNVTGQVVTFPSGALADNTLYCFNWSSATAVTTSTAGNDLVGSVTTRTSGAATIDSSEYAVSVIANDQIVVTAAVNPTFSFSLSSNTVNLGTLSAATISSGTAVNATFSTNAAGGVMGWMASTNGSLTSPSTGQSIISPGTSNAAPETLAAGTSGYVVDVDFGTNGTAGTGAVTVDPEYNGTTTSAGGHLATTLQPIFTSNGTHANGQVAIVPRVAISAVQGAAQDYSDTLTVVAAGRF